MTSQDWHEKRFCKGEFIFKEGAWGDRIFEIQSGEVVIFKKSPENQMVPVATVGPGEIFGEMYLLNKDHVRNASAVATSELIVKVYFEEVIIQDMVSLTPRQRKLVEGLTKKLANITDVYVVHKAQEIGNNSLSDSVLNEGQNVNNKFAPSFKPISVNRDKISSKNQQQG